MRTSLKVTPDRSWKHRCVALLRCLSPGSLSTASRYGRGGCRPKYEPPCTRGCLAQEGRFRKAAGPGLKVLATAAPVSCSDQAPCSRVSPLSGALSSFIKQSAEVLLRVLHCQLQRPNLLCFSPYSVCCSDNILEESRSLGGKRPDSTA